MYMYIYMYICLVGGFNPSEKYELVSWDSEIPNIWKKSSKPPTRYIMVCILSWMGVPGPIFLDIRASIAQLEGQHAALVAGDWKRVSTEDDRT